MSSHATAVTDLLGRLYAAEERYIASGGQHFEELAPMVHEEFVLHQAPSLPFGGTWRGRDGFEAFLAAFSEAWESLDVVDPRVYDLGSGRALTVVTMHARARRTGSTLRTPLCQIVRFEDDLLIEVRPFYWDTAVANAVLGHRPDENLLQPGCV
jgi:ketosteroid isomerase-like protein